MRTKLAWLVTPAGIGSGVLTHVKHWAQHVDLERFDPVAILGVRDNVDPMGSIRQLRPLRVVAMPALLSRNYVRAVSSLTQFLDDESIEILHTVLIQSDIMGALAALFRGQMALISSSVGYPYRSSTQPWKKFIYRITYSSLHRRFDRILTSSHHTRDKLEIDFGVSPSRTQVIHNCVTGEIIDTTEHFSVPEGQTPVVGTMSSLIPEKGVADFIEAACQIRMRAPRAQFIVAGDGPESEALQAQANRLGLTRSIEFTGWTSSALDLMRKLDVFVMPSYEEGLSYVVLEAMACRRPVVSYSVGGIPEVITDGEHGILVERGNTRGLSEAVLRCLENPAWARRLGEQARTRIENEFHAAKKVRALEQVYCSVLSARGDK